MVACAKTLGRDSSTCTRGIENCPCVEDETVLRLATKAGAYFHDGAFNALVWLPLLRRFYHLVAANALEDAAAKMRGADGEYLSELAQAQRDMVANA